MARDRLEFPVIRSYISLHDLVETLAGTHGALDVERAHVLPILLEQRHQEIDGETDIGGQVVRLHGDVADGDGQAQDLRGKLRSNEEFISSCLGQRTRKRIMSCRTWGETVCLSIFSYTRDKSSFGQRRI